MSKILIVDDEPTLRTLLCNLLSRHACRAVRSAEEGLKLLSEEGFDLVITDVRLPGMGGEEFLRAAHEIAPDMHVIVMTGADGDATKFKEAGAFGYLLKPFKIEEVDEAVERALRERR